MVMQTPMIRKRIRKLKFELALLMLKKKIMDSLSEADEKRVMEIRAALAVRH